MSGSKLEQVYFWVPNPDFPHAKYGDLTGMVVGEIIGYATLTDVSVKVLHSVHPKYKIGSQCRRCRLKLRRCEFVDGAPVDADTRKVVMPNQAKVNKVPAKGNEDSEFNPDKYNVVKTVAGNVAKVVKGHFVLLPEKDPAAFQALRTYLHHCSSPGYKKALKEWVDRIERDIVPLWRDGKGLGTMGRINANLDVLTDAQEPDSKVQAGGTGN